MINSKKIFAIAKEKNIEPFELQSSLSTSVTIKVFMDEVESYNIANNSEIRAKGIIDGKIGSFSSDKVANSIAPMMFDAIEETAKYGKEYDSEFFIEPGRKYHRPKHYISSLDRIDVKEYLELCRRISQKVREKEKRITITSVFLEYEKKRSKIENSKGLKLMDHRNHLFIYCTTKYDYQGEIQSGFEYQIIDDFAKFDEDEFVNRVIKKTIAQVGAKPVKSGKYTVLFNPECTSILLLPILSHLSQYSVNKHLSRLEKQLNQLTFSKKLTIVENPFAKNIFGAVYDAEGVPTTKKVLIDKGTINCFYSDLESAKEAGTESTGNASYEQGNVKPSVGFCALKRGKKSFDETLAYIKNGIYITDLEGVGTGLSMQTGNYSLQADGFLIKDGKLDRAVSLITVAGNVFDDFKRIAVVSSDSEITLQGISTPPLAIRKLSISGK
ncbi:MAG: TldD/PmbA family protein [Bacilli bacterium]|nr:TldD/PmbA family protein [Bacilli bacterium]